MISKTFIILSSMVLLAAPAPLVVNPLVTNYTIEENSFYGCISANSGYYYCSDG